MKFLYPKRDIMDYNKVMIIGRSTTQGEVKKIESSGTSVINFTVATNRKFKNKEGNILEEAEYHKCVAYGNSADILGKYLEKGKRIFIEGRLKTRRRQDSNGNDRQATEIIIENFIFLDFKGPKVDEEINIEDLQINTQDIPF